MHWLGDCSKGTGALVYLAVELRGDACHGAVEHFIPFRRPFLQLTLQTQRSFIDLGHALAVLIQCSFNGEVQRATLRIDLLDLFYK